ncbi:MAG: ATPase [Alphaproteobacteria bacterium]|nr:ATPase [Alphaproteobacteria bacterium]
MNDNLQGSLSRRFYREVTVEMRDEGYELLLDGCKAMTPGKRPLFLLARRRLAEVIAEEWRAQKEYIDPRLMPLTQMATRIIDHVTIKREAIIGELLSYAGSDLLCYRAAFPENLRRLQDELWDPVLAWVEDFLSISVRRVTGVMPIDAFPGSLDKLFNFLEELDDFDLCAFSDLVHLLGSVFLVLALFCHHLSSEAAWQAAYLDEDWQNEHWGIDEEARQLRAHRRFEMDRALFFLSTVSPPQGPDPR